MSRAHEHSCFFIRELKGKMDEYSSSWAYSYQSRFNFFFYISFRADWKTCKKYVVQSFEIEQFNRHLSIECYQSRNQSTISIYQSMIQFLIQSQSINWSIQPQIQTQSTEKVDINNNINNNINNRYGGNLWPPKPHQIQLQPIYQPSIHLIIHCQSTNT